jgi:tetratricopeptide (TPR) repeat protein
MADDSKTPGLVELIREKIFRRFGIPGLVVLALIAAAPFVWWQWDKISKLPGVAHVVTYFSRHAIPLADPNRFSVMVAHLENDTNREQERLIVEALKEFEGIQVLELDRTIPLKGPVPEKVEKQGHESALGYLKQSRASVLIWGTALSQGGKTIPKLYWTASQGWERKPKRYDAPRVEDQLRLPEVFWSDLSEILRLLVATRGAEFSAEEGHYVADRLSPFIARVQTLLKASGDRPGWDADALGSTRVVLGNALQVLGDQSGRYEALEEAAAVYEEALEDYTRDRVPLDWAGTQNNLGNALARLGARERSTERVEEAVAAYREALKEWSQDRAPLHWAMTQSNLGAALTWLGHRESGTERFEEAVAAYHEALKGWSRDRTPLYWAMTQNNLGATLRALGERQSSTSLLEESVTAYRAALKERARDRVPLQWAKTQNNLGIALRALGERQGSTSLLEESVTAYRDALKERTQDRVPLEWASTQNNLGNALRALGEWQGSIGLLEESVAAYRAALKERTRNRAPLEWAGTQNGLGNALHSLGKRQGSTGVFEEAMVAYREALKECTRDRVPLEWAIVQGNLGATLISLGERESGTEHLEEAVVAYKAALEVFEPSQATHYFETARASLQRAETLLQQRRK